MLLSVASQLQDQRAIGLRATALLVREKPPSVPWMVLVMSTLAKDHEIFEKHYRPPKEGMAAQVSLPLINDPEGFFADLPLVMNRGRRMINLLDPKIKERIRTDHLNARLRKAMADVEKHKQLTGVAEQVEESGEGVSNLNPCHSSQQQHSFPQQVDQPSQSQNVQQAHHPP